MLRVERLDDSGVSLADAVIRYYLPDWIIRHFDISTLYRKPDVFDLVHFVQSASPQSLLVSGEQNLEHKHWLKWGDEMSAFFVKEDDPTKDLLVNLASQLLSPYQQVGLVKKLWIYGEKGSDRRVAVEKLIHTFWNEDDKLARNDELLRAVTEFSLGLPKDLADRLPDSIRERITVVEEPPETEFLD